MDSYDAIIYGSDLNSLITALFILKKEKRVLLADPDNRVGNFTDYYLKHRFTFEKNYNSLIFDPKDSGDLINSLVKELKIESNFVSDTNLGHIIAISKDSITKKEYILPIGIDNFIDKVEEYVPDSKLSVTHFFSLAEECRDAIKYIIQNDFDEKYIKDNFPNFVKVVSKSVSDILDSLDMPIAAQEIINSCWIYFGTSETELSFVDYSSFLYDLVTNNIQTPIDGYENIAFKLFQQFLKKGGNYINGVELNKIITLDHEVTGVLLNKEIYYTSNFVTSISPSKVYNSLIEKDEVPREALQLCNKRKSDGTPFTIFLGLNRTAKTLGFDCAKYLIYNTLDSDVEYRKMSSINNNNSIVTINNYLNPNISPEGTTFITIESYFFNDIFEDYIDYEKYNNCVDDITNNLITSFEEKTGIRIRDYIEEIQVITPVDYFRKYKDNSYFGYKLKPLDNTVIRCANYQEEEYIKGLFFCSQYGIMGGTFNNMLLTSKFIAERVAKR